MIQDAHPTNSPYVVAFNGPPRVGKDTIATELANLIDTYWDISVHTLSFATPMREAAMNLFGVQTYKEYNEKKDIPHPILGTTLRQFMISLSEKHMKPTMGKDIWGRILHSQASGWWGKLPAIVLLTDLGFEEESKYIESQVEPGHYWIAQLERLDTNWDGDSRGYVTPAQPHSWIGRFNNDGPPSETAWQIFRALVERSQWPFPSF